MTPSSHITKRRLVTCTVLAAGLLLFICVSLVFLPGLRRPWRLLSFKDFKQPPPDLTRCTRIELQYKSSTPKQPSADAEKRRLFSPDEERYLKSLEFIALENPEDIKVLADEVLSARYQGRIREPTRAAEYVRVVGYCGAKRVVPFVIWGTAEMETEDGFAFENTRFSMCLWKLRPQAWPFRRRTFCAENLRALRSWLIDPEGRYLAPSQWCDAVERRKRASGHSDNSIKWSFRCSCMHTGRCHYAINPDCRPDSPPDMVLLFEAEEGWNQHGGPELFTFTNHDPRGGLVLLNDNTVKFIRTEEELKQLRWK